MARNFTEEMLRKHWGTEKPILYKCRLYRVGRMSYGDYFLEPFNPKHPGGSGEREPFHRSTIWLEKEIRDHKPVYIVGR